MTRKMCPWTISASFPLKEDAEAWVEKMLPLGWTLIAIAHDPQHGWNAALQRDWPLDTVKGEEEVPT